MKKTIGFLLLLSLWGCGQNEPKIENSPKATGVGGNLPSANKDQTSTPPSSPPGKSNVVQVGPGVYLEVEGDKRTVVISSKVVRREGLLELLLCREKTKEHESILAAAVDARDMHQAMLTAGLKPGTPVQFLPNYKQATGSSLDIKLRYKTPMGQDITIPAKEWVKKSMANDLLEADWVYAGSRLVPNSLDPKAQPYFLANDGDLISISNFESSLIDVSIKISSANSELGYEPVTSKIPPVGTPVAILISPVIKSP